MSSSTYMLSRWLSARNPTLPLPSSTCRVLLKKKDKLRMDNQDMQWVAVMAISCTVPGTTHFYPMSTFLWKVRLLRLWRWHSWKNIILWSFLTFSLTSLPTWTHGWSSSQSCNLLNRFGHIVVLMDCMWFILLTLCLQVVLKWSITVQ